MLDINNQAWVAQAAADAAGRFYAAGQEAIGMVQNLQAEYLRPFILYKPRIAQDGDMWIACLGDNLQEGIVGVGKTPDEASRAFDKAWYEPAASTPKVTSGGKDGG
jgi:hypothetical protein